jgi:chemosensory pili system protein ChpA (sensor histidine kinase/response regulator)
MSTTSKIDPSTLGWVKTEIDESLRQAHVALESFAENPSEDTQLRYCVTHLHQVVGTLQMVELDGAAMLVREAEALASAVLDEQIEANDANLELLSRAILLLPDYLGGLQFGRPDTPLKLLPLMNELRTARKLKVVAEEDLFTPDLSVRPPPRTDGKVKLSEADYAELAQKLRPAFQVALLSWLRDSNDTKSLTAITNTVEDLQATAPVALIEQLFWVAGGLLEALSTGALEPDNERKKLIARLDQQIKKIIDGGEKSLLRTSSEALVKSILFQLGGTRAKGPRVTQLKRAFGLDAVFGGETDDSRTITELPEARTVESVSSALHEEIHAAQELLAAYFDPDQEDVNSLEPLLGQLQRFSSTVDLLGIPELKALVDKLLEVATAIVKRDLEPNEDVSMRMAQALLLVENCSRDIWAPNWKKQVGQWTQALQGLLSGDNAVVPETDGIEVAEVGEAEFGELVSVVAGEIHTTLTKVEEAIEEFAADTSTLSRLAEIPGHMTQVHGAFQMLNEERALQLAEAVSARIEELRSGKLAPTQALLDALAVCVGTLTAYAEGLQHGRLNIDDLMDAALNDMASAVRAAQLGEIDHVALLEQIQIRMRQWLDDIADADALKAVQQGLDDIALLAVSQGQERIERISNETNALLSIVAEDPTQLSPEVAKILRQSFEALTAFGKQHLRSGTADEPISKDVTPAPASTTQPESTATTPTEDTVTSVQVEEPAQAEVAPEHVATPVTETTETVEAVVPANKIDVAPTTSATTVATPAPTAPPPRVADTIDAEMLEIFVDEAKEVLGNVGKNFPLWRNDPENAEALAEVRRGFHTLKGSGRMVGAMHIGELAWSVENLLNKIRDKKIAHSDAIFELVEATIDVLPAMIAQLQGGPAATTDTEALQQKAHALAASKVGTDAREPAPVPETETPVESAAPLTQGEFPKLEATLLQIYTGETRAQLETVESEIASCHDSGGRCLVSAALLRATHTLHGGARSIGLRPMSAACGEMERLLEQMQETGLLLEPTHLAMFEEMVDCVRELLGVLNDESRSGAGLSGRFEDLGARLRAGFSALTARESAEPPVQVPPEAPVDEPQIPTLTTPASVSEQIPVEVPEIPPLVPAAPVTTPALGIDEDIDPELVDVFLEEATDLLGSIDEALTQWRANRGVGQAVEDLKRTLHTLKGSARMASAMSVGQLAHNTEDLIRRVEDGRLTTSAELFDLLHEVHDTLVMLIDQIRQARPLSSTDRLRDKIARVLAGGPIVDIAPAPVTSPAARAATPATEVDYFPVEDIRADIEPSDKPPPDRRAGDYSEPERLPERRDRRGQVRVRTSVLSDLVNYAGEVSIARSRMEQQVHGLRENLTELNRNVTRFREQIRELEIQSESQILYRMEQAGESESTSGFDPLEMDRFSRLQQLSRTLTESLHDLSNIQSNLQTYAGEAESALQQQARINANLQEGLMRTRMIPFSTQAARLRHITRQTGRELDKRAELQITGTDVGVDRTVLERMMGPFEHMIRNSLDHGIEDAEERRRAGKPPEGKIVIDTSQEGTEIVIHFSDDGRGLAIDAIRHRAIQQGLMAEDSDLSDDELIQFILVSGFSTAQAVTHLSGRGVGMDVVENEVKQLGGSMAVHSTRGEGTTFTIRLPVTLSITQALLVQVGDQKFAVPLSAVVNIIELPLEKLSISAGKTPLLNYDDKVYSFMHLANRLGIYSEPRNGGKVPILLSRIGTRDVALRVDSLLGTKEIVVKPLSPQLSELKGLAGATMLGDGTVLLILDIGGLWLTDQALQVEHVAPVPREQEASRRPVVMVVDDSLTVRKVTGRHLQKRGMDVLTAKDGVDAIEQLQDHSVDVMLVDIEMPRMDGYELTSRIKSESRFKHIPIIMITSRAGEKHRKRAFDLGVNIYMSKPYQEDELFANIDGLLAKADVHVGGESKDTGAAQQPVTS